MADNNTYTSKQNIKKYTTQAKFDAIDKSDVPVGTEYNIVGEIEEADLSSELQVKINSTTPVDQTYSATSENAQSGKAVAGALSGKQNKLVSGQNIKTINGQSVLRSGDIRGVVREKPTGNLILQFMGNDQIANVPYGFYAPTAESIGDIIPIDLMVLNVNANVDIIEFSSVYLFERVDQTEDKLIKNVTPLILTRGDNGFSGAVLMKAPALNDTDSDVYFVMNVSWVYGGIMLAQINGLRLNLRVTNDYDNEFVGHIIIPSAKWAEGSITFMPESLCNSGLDCGELPAVFANQNSVYIFHQVWNTENDFQGISIERANAVDGGYSTVPQDDLLIDIVPYSI